jgi:osmoprotectant transport system permease protein
VAFFTYIAENSDLIMSSILRHFVLFLISMAFAVTVGTALSIIITREGHEKMGQVILSITGASQAVPSVAVIALVFLFIGIGMKPAIIALVIYSLVPIVFNATSGILSVDPGVIQAAKGMGLTRTQRLWRIKIPLAMPVIMSGIRSAATINIIYTGLKLNRPEMILIGAGFAAIIAILVDTVLYYVEQKVTPKGLA